MKHMGEDIMSTEGAKLSGASGEAEPYADTTLESPLNGRRRCTNIALLMFLISQANGQSNSSIFAALLQVGEVLISFVYPPELSLFRWVFIFYIAKGKR